MEARSFLRSVVHVCLCEAAVCSVLSSEADRMTLRLYDSNLHFLLRLRVGVRRQE